MVHLAHRLQLTNPPSQTEVKLELVEQFPATTLDWQLQISDIHSVGEELIQREEVKKKLRNNSTEQDLPKVVEPPINGKHRNNLAETKSLKQDRSKQPSVEPIVIKREKDSILGGALTLLGGMAKS